MTCHSGRIGHVLQVLFGTAFGDAKTLKHNNAGSLERGIQVQHLQQE